MIPLHFDLKHLFVLFSAVSLFHDSTSVNKVDHAAQLESWPFTDGTVSRRMHLFRTKVDTYQGNTRLTVLRARADNGLTFGKTRIRRVRSNEIERERTADNNRVLLSDEPPRSAEEFANSAEKPTMNNEKPPVGTATDRSLYWLLAGAIALALIATIAVCVAVYQKRQREIGVENQQRAARVVKEIVQEDKNARIAKRAAMAKAVLKAERKPSSEPQIRKAAHKRHGKKSFNHRKLAAVEVTNRHKLPPNPPTKRVEQTDVRVQFDTEKVDVFDVTGRGEEEFLTERGYDRRKDRKREKSIMKKMKNAASARLRSRNISQMKTNIDEPTETQPQPPEPDYTSAKITEKTKTYNADNTKQTRKSPKTMKDNPTQSLQCNTETENDADSEKMTTNN